MERPTTEQVRQELTRTEYGRRYRAAMRSTVYTLVVVAAVAILVATLLLPVLRTYGKSMTPTLDDGNIVFSVKASSVERGDIIAFYYNNKILIKRVVGISGEWIDIMQHQAALSGAGEPRVRHGRSQIHLGGLPHRRDRLHRGGADRRKAAVPRMAPVRNGADPII